MSASFRRTTRGLGAIVVVRGLAACRRRGRLGGGAHYHDPLALYLPPAPLTGRWSGAAVDCPAGGAMLIEVGTIDGVPDDDDDDGIVVFLPRGIVSALPRDHAGIRVMSPSLALSSVRRLAAALLASDLELGPAQLRLAGRALSEFVAAALMSLPVSDRPRLAAAREASLLDNLTAYVDRHLADDLDVASLCAALGCSRSALYRAASPVGGVAAQVGQRRLEAVYLRLCDPAERRSIAALARAHGLVDPAAFSRHFKRRFGLTALGLRRREHPLFEARRS